MPPSTCRLYYALKENLENLGVDYSFIKSPEIRKFLVMDEQNIPLRLALSIPTDIAESFSTAGLTFHTKNGLNKNAYFSKDQTTGLLHGLYVCFGDFGFEVNIGFVFKGKKIVSMSIEPDKFSI